MGRKYWKWTRTKGSELMNIEGFAFCNCSFFFSWPNSHSLLLVRIKLWSSKDSCKKRFLLYCLSLNMKFAYFFSIFFFWEITPSPLLSNHFILYLISVIFSPLLCINSRLLSLSFFYIVFSFSLNGLDFIYMNLFKKVYLAKAKFISRMLLLNGSFKMVLCTENATQINNIQVPFKPFLYRAYSFPEMCFYPLGTKF